MGEPMTGQELAAAQNARLVDELIVQRDGLLAEVDRLKAERDAAVRERDEARQTAVDTMRELAEYRNREIQALSRRQPFEPERERVRRDLMAGAPTGASEPKVCKHGRAGACQQCDLESLASFAAPRKPQ